MALQAYEYHINQIRVGRPLALHLSKKEAWIQELLNELQEEVDPSDLPSDSETQSQLTFDGSLERFNEGHFKNHMQLKGEVKASFYTLDVQTGEVIVDQLQFPIHSLILDAALVESMGLEEGGELELNGIEWEVFPYINDVFDFKEFLHELLFLHRNPYPTA